VSARLPGPISALRLPAAVAVGEVVAAVVLQREVPLQPAVLLQRAVLLQPVRPLLAAVAAVVAVQVVEVAARLRQPVRPQFQLRQPQHRVAEVVAVAVPAVAATLPTHNKSNARLSIPARK
jgi:hypothetical protein